MYLIFDLCPTLEDEPTPKLIFFCTQSHSMHIALTKSYNLVFFLNGTVLRGGERVPIPNLTL